MNEKKKKDIKNPLTKTILTWILYWILYMILVTIQGLLDHGEVVFGVTGFMTNLRFLFIGIMILVLYWLLHRKEMPGFLSVKNTGKGLLMGWSLLLISFFIMLSDFVQKFPLGNFFAAVVMGISPGLCEEVMFRIIPLSTVRRLPGKNKQKALFITYLMTGIAFGLIHAFNVLVGADRLNSLIQVLYAVGIGLLFAGIYLLTNNLWIGIILHSLVDFAGLITVSDQQAGGVLEESRNLLSNAIVLIFTVIIYINAFLVWRKMKEEKIF